MSSTFDNWFFAPLDAEERENALYEKYLESLEVDETPTQQGFENWIERQREEAAFRRIGE
jgi:hypothetical protein